MEAGADGDGTFDEEKVAVEEVVVPEAAGEGEGEDVGVEGHHPLEQENVAAESRLLQDRVEAPGLLLQQEHEEFEDLVDLLHLKAVEPEQMVLSQHQVGK